MNRLRAFLALLLLGTATAAGAHDSWFMPGPGGLQLSTGNRFPVQEFSLPPGDIVSSHCHDGSASKAMRSSRALPLALEFAASSGALSCWAQVRDHEVEIEPDKVKVYFAEIQANQSVRDTWTRWHADGLAWRERYSKFARIELAGAAKASPEQRLQARKPVGAGLEIVVLGAEPIATASPLAFQVLRDGQPLAGFPVELVSERSPIGIWRRTDADGRLQHTLPFTGRWLLRGTDLRTADEPGRWSSRFVTLAIEAP